MTRSLGDNTYTIVYNGELYNTARASAASSSARGYNVLLPLGYRGAADVVCGMGSVVRRKTQRYISRLRYGTMPNSASCAGARSYGRQAAVYRAHKSLHLLFASEIKAILKPTRTSQPVHQRKRAAWNYLRWHRHAQPAKRCLLRHRRAAPGRVHDLFTSRDVYVHRYWQYESLPNTPIAWHATKEKLSWLIDRRHPTPARVRCAGVHIPVRRCGFEYTVRYRRPAKHAAEKGNILRTFSVDFL